MIPVFFIILKWGGGHFMNTVQTKKNKCLNCVNVCELCEFFNFAMELKWRPIFFCLKCISSKRVAALNISDLLGLLQYLLKIHMYFHLKYANQVIIHYNFFLCYPEFKLTPCFGPVISLNLWLFFAC